MCPPAAMLTRLDEPKSGERKSSAWRREVPGRDWGWFVRWLIARHGRVSSSEGLRTCQRNASRNGSPQERLPSA